MNSAFLDLGPSGRISSWISILEATRSHLASKPSAIHTLKCLLFIYNHDVNTDGYHLFDSLIDEIRSKENFSWSSSQKRANRSIRYLIDGGAISRHSLNNYPSLKNGRQPFLYTLTDPTTSELKMSNLGGNDVPFYQQALLTKDYKNKLSSDPAYNYISSADISSPINTRLTTLLVGLGSRVSSSDEDLLVTNTRRIDGYDVKFRCYASGATAPTGELLGRMYGRDASILYLIQTRDSQAIAKRIKKGETHIENRFTLDVHDLLSEMREGKGENRGGSTVGISNAINRIAEMSYTIEADQGSSIAKALTAANDVPANRLYIKLLYLLASGDDMTNTKYQRFFTYRHSDHAFKSMIDSNGMWYFDKDLITKNLGSYEQLFYILCRNNVNRGSVFKINLEQIYAEMLVIDHVSWKAFSDNFLKTILSFTDGVDRIHKGKSCEAKFIGYSIIITRPLGSLRSIVFEISQSGVEKLEALSGDSY
jgi:hypothetical protein